MAVVMFYILYFGMIALILGPLRHARKLMVQGKYRNAAAIYLRFYKIFKILPHWRAVCCCNYAFCMAAIGDSDTALSMSEIAMEALKRRQAPRTRASIPLFHGLILLMNGDYEEAHHFIMQALQQKSLPGRHRIMGDLLLIRLQSLKGDPSGAEALLDALEEKNKGSNAWKEFAPIMPAYRANIKSLLGDTVQAAELWGIFARRNLTGRDDASIVLANYACFLAADKQVAEAKNIVTRLLQNREDIPPVVYRQILSAQAGIALQEGDADRARRLAGDALLGERSPIRQASLLMLQAEASLLLKNASRALALCNQALTLSTLPFLLQRAEELRRALSPQIIQAPSAVQEAPLELLKIQQM